MSTFKGRNWRIRCGDVMAELARIPSDSIHCVPTSPPYWKVRDYGVAGQIGQEPTIQEYVQVMVNVFEEVRRVLHSQGTLWLNLGDCYNGSGGAGGDYDEGGIRAGQPKFKGRNDPTLKRKDLCGVPWRTALALQDAGWWLRSAITWYKPNPAPGSAPDRPRTSSEMIFLMTKSDAYFYDQDAYDPGRPALHDVWVIPTEGVPEAHFATFPKEIPLRAISLGTSEVGVCPECGWSWVRLVEKGELVPDYPNAVTGTMGAKYSGDGATGWDNTFKPRHHYERLSTDWVPSCSCPHDQEEAIPPVVLDPFCGSGQTGIVAKRLHRRFVGIELNEGYAEMAARRIRNDIPPMLTEVEPEFPIPTLWEGGKDGKG